MEDCKNKIITEDIIFDGCDLENCNFEKGDNLNKILNNLCQLIKLAQVNSEFLIIPDRHLITETQDSVITGYGSIVFEWYVDDVLQTNNSSNRLIVNKKCKVYALSYGKRSNTIYIDLKADDSFCDLLVNILNVQP